MKLTSCLLFIFFSLTAIFVSSYVLFDTQYGRKQIKHYLVQKLRSITPFSNLQFESLDGNLPTNFSIHQIQILPQFVTIDDIDLLWDWSYNPLFNLHPHKNDPIYQFKFHNVHFFNHTIQCLGSINYIQNHQQHYVLDCQLIQIHAILHADDISFFSINALNDSLIVDLHNGYIGGTIDNIPFQNITFETFPNEISHFQMKPFESQYFYPIHNIKYNSSVWIFNIGSIPFIVNLEQHTLIHGPVKIHFNNDHQLELFLSYGQYQDYNCMDIKALMTNMQNIQILDFEAKSNNGQIQGDGIFSIPDKKLKFNHLNINFN